MEIITILLIIISLVLFFLYYLAKKELKALSLIHEELKHNYLSKSVKHGQHFEQFAPFTKEFEKIASKENFSFLGQPIDGISFEPDSIKFIEFKTGTSSLSAKQKTIKNLIDSKKVSWHEIRF